MKTILVSLLALPLGYAQNSYIPQIVDGGPWVTTIVVTNTGSTQTTAALTFYQETGGGATSSWNLNFVEMTSAQAQSLTLPAGTTVFLHTQDTAAGTTIGWGQLSQASGAGTVAAYAIFTQLVPGRSDQDGTAPAAPASSRILVPFDNTSGAVSSMAIANTTSSSLTVNVGIRTSSATTQPSSITLPPLGHASFAFPTQFAASAGADGLAEFYSPSGSFSILALKFNSGAFTTAPVYLASGAPIFASSGAGGGGTPIAGFDGAYTGSFSGNGGSGPVVLSVSNGVLTVTTPGSGSGTVAANGQVTFGVDITSGLSCNFTGMFAVTGAASTGSGSYTCPSQSISGTWSVSRS